MVAAIRTGLDLRAEDVVLDLACGNGALSARLFDSCAGLVGVDASEYLIEVAKANFELVPRYTFLLDDAAHYAESEPEPERFSKVLCYGSFSYFSYDDARARARRARHEIREREDGVHRQSAGSRARL